MNEFMNDFSESFLKSKQEFRKKEDGRNHIITEKPKFCVHCGAPLEEGNSFCTECGAKIEDETVSAENSLESSDEKKEIRQNLKISSDRMASIKETALAKSGKKLDELKKLKTSTEAILGHYIYNSDRVSICLAIQNIVNIKVTASLEISFSSGCHAIEYYSGTLIETSLELKLLNADLHSSPREKHTETRGDGIYEVSSFHIISKSESFSGIVSENKISGTLKGEHPDSFIVLTKA